MKCLSCCLLSHTLQPGVGPADANLLLAEEFASRGHRVSLCGLNDRQITQARAEELICGGTRIPALSLPETMSWSHRRRLLRDFLEKENPDHVILRFIPYSLNRKGIVWQAALVLPGVLSGKRVIWLMDEIWFGENACSFRHKIVGRLQRACIFLLIRRLKPRRIFTNNRANSRVLQRYGLNAETLRLFGNIPVVASDGGQWLFREFDRAKLPITPANRSQWLLLGNFGAFHPNWNPDAFLASLRDRAASHGMRVAVVGIGGLGACEDHWRSVASKWGGDLIFHHLGRRDAADVSLFLQSVDFGLATNHYHLVGKSGTCMAMLDHGLPILVPQIADDDDPTEFPPHLVMRCGDVVDDSIFAPRQRHAPDPQLQKTAGELIAAMSGPL
jgi:hypothetical protein